MHEHIARAMYYFSIHLLYASAVGSAAWALTAIPHASATTKYWIWVITALNFAVPAGAVIDKLWAPRLAWAAPLGAVGGPVWDMTDGPLGIGLAVLWTMGTVTMLARLISRLCKDHREAHVPASGHDAALSSVAESIPVTFNRMCLAPAVDGIFSPRILLPVGIDRLLSRQELHAVLLHEMAHAKRRDNLIRLFYEFFLCVLWFHPLVWLAGKRISLYRELSCDESVIRRAHGQALVQALAKLAIPEGSMFLQAQASSHLSHRLARLAGARPAIHRAGTFLLTSLFAAIIAGGVFETVAHTACCFIPKH